VLAHYAGADVVLVDSAVTTAEAVARLLSERDLSNSSGVLSPRFLATDAPDRFARVGEIFLGQPIDPGSVELIDLQ
jgi:glutamate racemase